MRTRTSACLTRAHNLVFSLTHTLSHTHTHSLTRTHTHSLTHTHTHSRCFKCHSASRHSQAPEPCMCACAATAVFAAGRARLTGISPSFLVRAVRCVSSRVTAPTLSRWTQRTRPRQTSGLGRGGGTAYAALETAVDAGTGAVEGAIYAVRIRRTLIWMVVWLAYLLSPVPSPSPLSRLVRFPPLFLSFFLPGCSLFMVYSFSIARGKMLSAELRPVSGFCPTMNSRTVDFGISCSSGSVVFASVCDHDDLEATAVLLWSALRAQGRLEAWHIGNSGHCKRARSCESANSGASQNSFSINGQGDRCTLF